jgi:Terminase large subunit, T4likevirus-type, N-terminal/Terminase RNaseH-like domain
MAEEHYLGNPLLKKAYTKQDLTQEQVIELGRCSVDPVYFAKNYMRIVTLDHGLQPFATYPFQERMLQSFQANRFNICLLSRQSGKTTTVVSFLLQYAIFNENINIAVLANKASTARDILNRLQTGYENLPKWMQQGVCSWNKGSMELENGSKIIAASTSASSVRGGTYNIIFLDEFAFVPQQVADNFMSSVYPTITSGKETKVIIVSTPNGMNQFYKLWDDAIKQKNKYIPTRVYWHDIPGRDERFKQETIANMGQSRWDAEFECDFLGSSDTLISGAKLSNLVTDTPIRSKDLLDVYEEPIPGKIYVITVDVAEGVELDYSAFVVFDTTQIPYRVVAKYRNNDIPSLRFPDVIEPVGRAYNDAFILCEVNNDSQVAYILHTEYGYPNVIQTKTLGRGGQVAGQNLAGKGVKYGIKMSKPVKRTGCLNLKTFIEEDKLIFNDRDIIGELTTFVSRYNSFSAEEGKNDDLTMCLVLFAWISTQEYFKEMTETDIRKRFREEHEQELEENDSTPFGFISSADSVPNELAELYDNYLGAERDADGNLWHTSDNDHSYFWNYNY